MTTKLVKDHLDELNDKDLKTFQWYLVQNKTEGCKSILQSQMVNATREETVDKMVQVYGEDGAMETAVDILFRMNHNNLAIQLTRAKERQDMEQQLHEPLCSDVRETRRDADPAVTGDLSCPVCCDIFTEPVVLQCGHSFCKTCVQKNWKGKICPKCPLCQQVMPTDAEPPINFSLKSLSERYRERRQFDPSGGHHNDSETYQTSRTIREKQEAFEKVKQFCDSSVEHIKSQRRDTEQKIKDYFDKLHLLLKTEEATRIAALGEEATQKIRMMQKMTELSRDVFSLSDTANDMEDLGADDSFLQNFRTEMERTQNALPDPQLLPQVLINVPKHMENLQFRVLEKMQSIIKQNEEVSEDKEDDLSFKSRLNQDYVDNVLFEEDRLNKDNEYLVFSGEDMLDLDAVFYEVFKEHTVNIRTSSTIICVETVGTPLVWREREKYSINNYS